MYQLTRNRVQSQQSKKQVGDYHFSNSIIKRRRNSSVTPIIAMEEEPTADISSVNICTTASQNATDKENDPVGAIHTTTVTQSELVVPNTKDAAVITVEKPKSTKPRVKFTNIEIRKYNRILGDNPACLSGPPLQLDWTYGNDTDDIVRKTIDDYESDRLPRRTRRQLVMTTITRRNMMVYHFGCSHHDVDEATRGIKKIRKQRQKTKSLTPAEEKRQEIAEFIAKKVKKTLLLGGGGIGKVHNSDSANLRSSNGILTDKKNFITAHEYAAENMSKHLIAVR